MTASIFLEELVWQQLHPQCSARSGRERCAIAEQLSCPSLSIVPVSRDGKIKVLCLPKNTTARIQPMDQGVMRTLEQRYKRNLMKVLVFLDTRHVGVPEGFGFAHQGGDVQGISCLWVIRPRPTESAAWIKTFGDPFALALGDIPDESTTTLRMMVEGTCRLYLPTAQQERGAKEALQHQESLTLRRENQDSSYLTLSFTRGSRLPRVTGSNLYCQRSPDLSLIKFQTSIDIKAIRAGSKSLLIIHKKLLRISV